jgi:hypothetical protein
MPFVVGLALISLSTGAPISIEVLSTSDEKLSYSFQQEIIDSSNLTSTFEKIADSIPEPYADLASPIALLCPSYLNEDEKKELVGLVNAVPKLSSLWVRVVDNIQMTLVQVLNKVPHPPQIELALEVGPDTATARLISTNVEDDICETTIEKEIVIRDIRSADLITQLVNPALLAIKEIPGPDDPKRKFTVNANDLSLKRILILDFCPTLVSSLVQELKSKFREIVPPVEFIVKNNLARHAAENSLAKYSNNSGDLYITNVCLLRVGIVKADGFVSTVIKHNVTFPTTKTVIFTTSMDKQATATIKVVIGVPPKGEDNTVIAELVLKDLTRRPRGVTLIRVTFNVEHMGETQIIAEELMEDGAMTGSTASIQLKDIVVGDTLTTRDIENILVESGNFILANTPYHDDAVESEAQWAGKEVQGDLPE